MSHAAALITCQMPERSGLPSRERGMAAPGACAPRSTGPANDSAASSTASDRRLMTPLSGPRQLVVEPGQCVRLEGPVEIVEFDLPADVGLLAARLDERRHAIVERLHLAAEGAHLVLRQHRSVAGNRRVEIERQDLVERGDPLLAA